ncbi:hypothetical protein [uncultured Erythrobacter sp.]|uniref:hypothetical protein n=1 Tax=uncultured Erythrobacter sp. TaxID=263913 RepID=UPI00262C2CA1|nr:hypothetical protein [uncultured Erythrobacter sp.]
MKSLLVGCAGCAFLAPSVAHADVVIGPRISYYFDNSNLRTSDLEGLQDARTVVDDEVTRDLRTATGFDDLSLTVQDNGSAANADQVGFAMVGAMVNFGDDRDRFTVTAMVGRGDATTELVSSRQTTLEVADISFNELSVIQTISQDEIDRFDAELTWQRRLNENFAILAGVRYERLDVSGQGEITIQETDEIRQFVAETLGNEAPTRNLDGQRQPARVLTDRSLETFSGRIGVTAFVPFSENAVAFFSGMVHGSNQPSGDFRSQFIGRNGEVVREETRTDRGEWSMGPDFAVGAQFILANNLALDIRYRAIMSFPISGDFDFSDSRVNHGVNLGLSLRL